MSHSDLPALSRALLSASQWRAPAELITPTEAMLSLPERAVQFGTGAFLRGFIEYYLDVANAKGDFGGRVVVVGSTGSGRDAAFTTQNGLFTLQTVGTDEERGELRVVGSVSRALNASSQWTDVLALARQREISVVFSNTTEAGLTLSATDVSPDQIPVSYPAKLTRFLFERAVAFDFDASAGVVVVPCELLEDNGDLLRDAVRQTAERWKLDARFLTWLNEAVPFCNTLVDRIVPGAPTAQSADEIARSVGYTDQLLTMAETYRLFAIEADDQTRQRLSFASADASIVVASDIRPYRERKVRLLNGTHTALAAIGAQAGVQTVGDAMRDAHISAFARQLLLDEIVPVLDVPEATVFGEAVLTRFANPHVHHRLTDIASQGTLKLRVRLLPLFARYAERDQHVPPAMVTALAAQLVFAHPATAESWNAAGRQLPPDDLRAQVRAHWDVALSAADQQLERAVAAILSDRNLWHADLSQIPGLEGSLLQVLATMQLDGMMAAVTACLTTTVAGGN